MEFRTIDELGIKVGTGTRVLLRVDANVPMDGAVIRDDAKLARVAPTIMALRSFKAVTIVISHLGEGGAAQSLAPVAERLGTMVGGRPPKFFAERIGSRALTRALAALRPGDIAVVENIRRYKGERENSVPFAKKLAALATCYVNDAFAVSHREHASVVAVARLLPAAAGPLMLQELAALDRLTDHPRAPFLALLGGAKITTKAPVMARLLRIADVVLVGGALAVQFLAARGYGVGTSLLEDEGIAIAKRIRRNPKQRNMILPLDVVVADPRARTPSARVVRIAPKPHAICATGEAILDIGPQTIRAYAEQLKSAGTILWNGPLGMFEQPPFHHGSVALARVIASRASSRAYGVAGGGETLAVLAMTGMAKYIDHASTGGGAMLAYIANDGALPGLKPLKKK